MAYRVVIGEDFKMVRDVFEQTVNSAENYRLAASFPTAAGVLEYCRTHPADLVILDVLITGSMNGLDAAEQIKQISPGTKIIIVTSMPELSYMKRARAIGAESFWHKEVQEQTILEIMDRTMQGESVYPGSVPSVQIGNTLSTDFTAREMEVLKALVAGASNREIADSLGIETATVKMHITNMLRKTGFRSRLELAVKARHYGIVIAE